MAALGLICAVASSSCWAQQSTSSTNDKPAVKAATAKSAQKSASKPVAKKTAEPKNSKSSKDAKNTKSAAKGKASKADEDKVAAADAVVEKTADKAGSAKPDTKVADRSADKPVEKTADKSTTAKTDVAPPAGTMMGAYGQSLMRPSASTTAAVTTVAAAGTAATLVAATQNAPAATPVPSTASALPPTALMGAAAGNANASDAVTRFLQQRGIVAQAQTGAEPSSPGLLNKVRDNASDLVLSAMNFLGVPYKRGGNSVNNGFDCSGFTRHIFEMSVGLVLPRRADEQAKLSSLVPIKKEDLKPGDLVFFNTMRATFSHVGIYVGEGKFIHSPRVGGAVRVEDMREAYWAKRFTGARRADLNQTPGT
ncbi:NlpC/P60 family protein [Roseateles sp. So40a]|uniref:C40 family peptidase n=1 Tax=Roseateles sp. So40a TaxID=3400226 RepID=UPI003A8B906D